MNKQELITFVAKKTGVTIKETSLVLTAILETIRDTVAEGDEVKLVDFGVFKTKIFKERNGRNPKSGESMIIPAKRVPTFTAGKLLKDSVEGNCHE